VTSWTPTLARALTNALNPFFVFTALYAFVAFAEAAPGDAALYLVVELLAAAAVAGFVLFMRRRSRVGDFWITARAERHTPALFLLTAFVSLLGVLAFFEAPQALFLLTLSIGLASAGVTLFTLVWKASAHCTVAGHAAGAALLLLGPLGLLFLAVLPLVVWSRVVAEAHTLPQALAGGALGLAFAVAFFV
jgi:hypothetical protein